jgi:glutamate-1-semialdehyde 2,1-aminomutase
MKYEEILSKIEKLTSQTPVDVPENNYSKALESYNQKFAHSKAIFEDLRTVLPGGIQHMNTLPKNPFPIIMKKAEGAYVYDVDNHSFIDYLSTSGPNILGHNFPEVRNYVLQVLKEEGPCCGLMTEHELLAAKAITKHVKSVKQIRWYQSGTEADMAAVRIARAYTGKQKIIKIMGHYHGWADQFLLDLHIPGTGSLFAYGVPKEYYSHTLSIPPNNIEAIEQTMKKYNGEGDQGIAAVICEPIGGDSGTTPLLPDFNKHLRELCDQYGVLLIFDEVVTGFRLALGGAQEYYGVKADLTTFGKIVAHEYPSAGAVGGPEDIMAITYKGKSPGSTGLGDSVFTAGTMAGNNITCAATYKAIECIEKTNAIGVAAQVADQLVLQLNELFESYNLPFFTYNIKSVIQLWLGGFYGVPLTRPDAFQQIALRQSNNSKYALLLALEGISTLQSIRMYSTLAHEPKYILEKTVLGFENFCKQLK